MVCYFLQRWFRIILIEISAFPVWPTSLDGSLFSVPHLSTNEIWINSFGSVSKVSRDEVGSLMIE